MDEFKSADVYDQDVALGDNEALNHVAPMPLNPVTPSNQTPSDSSMATWTLAFTLSSFAVPEMVGRFRIVVVPFGKAIVAVGATTSYVKAAFVVNVLFARSV